MATGVTWAIWIDYVESLAIYDVLRAHDVAHDSRRTLHCCGFALSSFSCDALVANNSRCPYSNKDSPRRQPSAHFVVTKIVADSAAAAEIGNFVSSAVRSAEISSFAGYWVSSCRRDWAWCSVAAFPAIVFCIVATLAAWAAMSATISNVDRDLEGCFGAKCRLHAVSENQVRCNVRAIYCSRPSDSVTLAIFSDDANWIDQHWWSRRWWEMSIDERMEADSDAILNRSSSPAIDWNFDLAMSTKGISADVHRLADTALLIVFELDSVSHVNRSPTNPSYLRCPYCRDCTAGLSMLDSAISAVALNSHCSDSNDRDWVMSMAMLIDAKHVAAAKRVRNCFDSPCWWYCWCWFAAALGDASPLAANYFAYNGHSGKCIRLSPVNSLVAPADKHHADWYFADDRTLAANLHLNQRKEKMIKASKKNCSRQKL